MSELPLWVADPALDASWDRIRARFERAGLVADGVLVLEPQSRAERQALGALLGTTVTRARVRIDLAALDERLKQRSGVGGLEAVLTLRAGRDLEDRPALRTARREARERPLNLARALVDAAWADYWADGLRRAGLLTRHPDAERVVRDAAVVLTELTATEAPVATQSRVELGARLLGDAHSLDRDRLVHHVVVRGLAAAAGSPVPDDARTREELWQSFGVEPDLVSRTCLVWGLRLVDAGPLAARLAAAADSGDPLHLCEWDLRRTPSFTPEPGTRVLVCENPRVLEAMADVGLEGWAGVCTSGEPNLVVDRVLSRFARHGVELRYHGDFDWPGVAIANRAVARYAVRPWLMFADDYLAAVLPGGPELVGRPVEPVWDAELGAAMRHQGQALHEESVLAELLRAMATAG